MAKKKDDNRIEAEKQRVVALLREAGVSDSRLELMDAILDNIAWQKVKLDEARAEIAEAGVAIPYDNGGGQSGIRENPHYKGYEALYKSYLQGMAKVLDCLADEAKAEAVAAPAPKTVLELVRARRAV